MMDTHYTALSVAPCAEFNEIHAQYLALARVYHPDAGGDAEKFKQINTAWTVLRQSATRKQYDAQLELMHVLNCTNCGGRGRLQRNITFSVVEFVTCKQCAGSGQL